MVVLLAVAFVELCGFVFIVGLRFGLVCNDNWLWIDVELCKVGLGVRFYSCVLGGICCIGSRWVFVCVCFVVVLVEFGTFTL